VDDGERATRAASSAAVTWGSAAASRTMSSTASSTTGLMFIPASNSFRNETINRQTTCQYGFERLLLCRRGEHVSTRNGGPSAASSADRAGGRLYGEVSPAQWMALRFFAGAKLSRTPSAFAEQSITRGTATQSHQSACGRRLPAPAEVGDRWTQRQSATDRQWSRCTRARPVRSSNSLLKNSEWARS
jgi:hypothetical protein